MKLSRFLCALLWWYTLLVVAAFLLLYRGTFVNSSHVVLAGMIAVVLATASLLHTVGDGPLPLFIITRITVSYLIPFLALLVTDRADLLFHRMPLSPTDLTRGLVFLLASTVVTCVGLRSGSAVVGFRGLGRTGDDRGTAGLSAKAAAILVVTVNVVFLIAYYQYGVGRYVDQSRGDAWRVLGLLIVPPETALFLMIVIAPSSGVHRGSRRYLIVALCTYVVASTLSGSKGAVYYPLFYLLIGALAYGGNFHVAVPRRPARAALLLAITLVVGAGGVYIGYYVKWVTRMASVSTGIARVAPGDVLALAQRKPRLPRDEALVMPVRRLSELEQIVTITKYPGGHCRDLTVTATLENAVDRMMPGTYFANGVLPSERLYAVCYRGWSILDQTHGVRRENDKWGMFGLAYAYAGPTVGLLAIGMVFFLLACLQGLVVRAGRQHRTLMLAVFLLVVEMVFTGFGIDYTAANVGPLIVKIVVYMSLLRWVDIRQRRRTGGVRAGLRRRLGTSVHS